jgi:RsiW-degrading membrane proteinase PrsW (M82 family)
MFYMGMIGLGFSLIENVNYISRYGFEVLKYRTFGAVLVHMICGLLLGYWIGVSKIKKSKFKERTISAIYLSSRPRLKSILYAGMGLLTACCFHGLWNYNIIIFSYYSTPIAILMLMVGFLACKLLSRDLIYQYQKSNKPTPLPSRMDKDLDKF